MKDLIDISEKFYVGRVSTVNPLGNGLINDTYIVSASRGTFVLQKLHSIFGVELLEDIAWITEYLSRRYFTIPQLVPLHTGELGFFEDGELWRMMTYIPGTCFESGISGPSAIKAAMLVGRFHNELSEVEYTFKHVLQDFHNTAQRISILEETLDKYKDTPKFLELNPLAEKILSYYSQLPLTLPSLPKRIIHGDLKINNIRFNMGGSEAISLLDLDTLGRDTVLIDIGDAVRTWCKHEGQRGKEKSVFSLPTFEDMLYGYTLEAIFLTQAEFSAIPESVETIVLELAARLVTDAFEEKYFRWQKSRYLSLYFQNKAHAEAQIAFYEDFQNQKSVVEEIINNYLVELNLKKIT